MIQFKRGSTIKGFNGGKPSSGTWSNIILEEGQPGYDKTTNRLKIGDGFSKWEFLPWLRGGLEKKQILDSEANAKARLKVDSEDTTIFTYGTEDPIIDDSSSKKLVGDIYLHQYDGPIETDYVIESGIDDGWTYRKWHSGVVECWCSYRPDNTDEIRLLNQYGSALFKSSELTPKNYPKIITFISIPTEIITAIPEESAQPVFMGIKSKNTEKTTSTIFLCGVEESTVKVTVNCYVKGRYKN